MKRSATNHVSSKHVVGLPLVLAMLVAVIWTVGCQETPLPGETYRKKAIAWPLFDFEKTAGINPDGTKWEKEKGDAICWLSTWEKERTYDQDGTLISRKERDGFFPLWSTEIEETQEFRHRKGAVLLFPHESYRKKGSVSGGTP